MGERLEHQTSTLGPSTPTSALRHQALATGTTFHHALATDRVDTLAMYGQKPYRSSTKNETLPQEPPRKMITRDVTRTHRVDRHRGIPTTTNPAAHTKARLPYPDTRAVRNNKEYEQMCGRQASMR